MSTTLSSRCEKALERVAEVLRSLVPQFAQLEEDGSGPPAALALRDALSAFPMPSDVLLINAAGFPAARDPARWWSLVRYDLCRPTTNEVRFAEEVKAADLPGEQSMLAEHFGVAAEGLKSICNLTLVSGWHHHLFTFLAPHDIRTQPEAYGQELAHQIVMDSRFTDVFLDEVDFNAKHNLVADEVLSPTDLLQLHPTSAFFPLTLEESQREVAGIQLIPQVPESVRRVVHWAKRLYVFGYFEYGFFTVANHYAFAALEAALHARWSAALPSPSVLRHVDKKKCVAEITLERTGHAAIRSYCRARGWQVSHVTVNGEPFPFTAPKLLGSLRGKNIINDWQRRRFRDTWLELRNYRSHLEFCPIDSPTGETLARAVEEINTLFDSLPPLSAVI